VRIVFLFAHPDDETFGCGGTIALYSRRGVVCTVVSATKGEAGRWRNAAGQGVDDLGKVRQAELECACRVLGARPPLFMGYVDGTLSLVDQEGAARRTLGLLMELEPDVLVTFDQWGVYGHRDHQAVHRWAQWAWEHWPGARPRLFYNSPPRSYMQELRRRRSEAGRPFDPSDVSDLPPEEYGTPDELVTTRIEISEVLELKRQAILCHRSQVDPEEFSSVQATEFGPLMGFEFFSLARGQPEVPGIDRDLLAGLV
jgi:N-acetyl-1-D-myo-inositol-2-amino-2-deoxy-alpha-D-glucopyranoside deacetylase